MAISAEYFTELNDEVAECRRKQSLSSVYSLRRKHMVELLLLLPPCPPFPPSTLVISHVMIWMINISSICSMRCRTSKWSAVCVKRISLVTSNLHWRFTRLIRCAFVVYAVVNTDYYIFISINICSREHGLYTGTHSDCTIIYIYAAYRSTAIWLD